MGKGNAMKTIQTITPLRIGLAGGLTDIPDFYEKFGGEVLTTTIDQYIRIHFTKLETDEFIVSSGLGRECKKFPEEIEHAIVREALKMYPLNHGVSIRIESDVSPLGSGLGSSSALAVGLLQGLAAMNGNWRPSPDELARDACVLEMEKLGLPSGKQDPYICAYGGVRHMYFFECGDVQVDDVNLPPCVMSNICKNLMLFDTGKYRSSTRILKSHQKDYFGNRISNLLRIKEFVPEMHRLLTVKRDNYDDMGSFFHWHWILKREMSPSTSTLLIDKIYEEALTAGAIGGRVLGAGGGGHILFYVPGIERQISVGRALARYGLKDVPFQFIEHGSLVSDKHDAFGKGRKNDSNNSMCRQRHTAIPRNKR